MNWTNWINKIFNTINPCNMTTFVTDRPKQALHILKNWAAGILIFTIPLVIDLLLKTHIVKNSFYYILLLLLLLRFMIDLNSQRIYKLSFDTDRHLIVFEHKSIFSKTVKEGLPFENCRVEINRKKIKWAWLDEPFDFYFLQNKTEVFTLSKSKDGFSLNTLNKMYETIESLSFPIIKL